MENEKKYYATEVDGESFDYDAYFNEDDAKSNDIWIGGNRDFCTINDDMYKEAMNLLDDMEYDVGDCWNDYDEEEEGYEEAVYEDQISVVKDYTRIEDRAKLEELLDIIEEYRHGADCDERELVCQVLSVLKGKEFKCCTLRGSCQGDWIYCIYPKDTVSQKYLDYIEAVYFGTGTEYEITCDAVTKEELEDAETYFDYTSEYNTDAVKAWLAGNIGCKPEDIVIRRISSRHTYVKYDYEEE